MAVAKAFEQPRVAELFQVLGHARLAQAEDPRQLRHAALALRAQHHDAQPRRVGEGFQLVDQLLGSVAHK